MKVIGFAIAVDGGTYKFYVNNLLETYCYDQRIHSKTPGQWYLNYPLKDNSNIIVDKSLLLELKKALIEYFNSNDSKSKYKFVIDSINE